MKACCFALILALSICLPARAADLDLGAMVQPVPLDAKFTLPDYHVWCGAPVKGPDGKYHLFYSRWPKSNPDGFAPGWAICSEVAYAVSDGPRGPFTHVNVALPARGVNPATGQKFWDGDMTHNPYIILKDGTYYLYYIGNYGDGTYAVHRNNDRIGVAWATHPAGPWTRLDAPVIDITPDPAGAAAAFDSLCVANPAITVRPDGKMLVIYKGVKNSGSLMGGPVRYGAAIADTPLGTYAKQASVAGQIFLPPGASAMEAEDPFIWYSTRYGNRYYAVTRDVNGIFTGAVGGLALFESADGLTWGASAHPKVLGSSFLWANGSASTYKVERPFVLIEDGVPVALYGATNGYINTSVSYNVQIPLAELPSVAITSPPIPQTAIAGTGSRLRLTANVTGSGLSGVPVIAWSMESGPGAVTFGNASAADTTAVFSSDGAYVLACRATTSAGSGTARVTVQVRPPTSGTATFREGESGYAHLGALIRGDSTAWNSGARDQYLVGKLSGGQAVRTVLAFGLTSIPSGATISSVTLAFQTSNTTGTGTVGALELRTLTAIPVEGTGNSGSSATVGAGTGVTWASRTGTVNWTAAGGDFSPDVLASTSGFNATLAGIPVAFASTPALVAAAQAASDAAQPLALMLSSNATEAGAANNFCRIASDDDPTVSARPILTVSYSGGVVLTAPVVSAGAGFSATNGVPAPLSGSAGNATSTVWSLVSGPGAAAFGNASQPTTTVTFGRPGSYILRLSASNSQGETSSDISVTVAPNPDLFADWQGIHWPATNDPATIGAAADPDGDGIPNLAEFGLGLPPKTPGALPVGISQPDESTLFFTYIRSRTASGIACQVEWSDTLQPNSWSTAGVNEQVVPPDTGPFQTLRATVPAPASGKRFLRLKVSLP